MLTLIIKVVHSEPEHGHSDLSSFSVESHMVICICNLMLVSMLPLSPFFILALNNDFCIQKNHMELGFVHKKNIVFI